MKYRSRAIATLLTTMAALLCATKVVAQSATCYADQINLASGWTDASVKTDDTVRWSNEGPKRGWVYFDLRALPNSPTSYSTVVLHYYEVVDTGNPTVNFRWAAGANPFLQNPGPLYDSLVKGFPLGSQAGSLTRDSITLPSWNQWPAIPNQFLMVSFVCANEGQPPSPHLVGAACGWRSAGTYRPFLEFIP